MSTVLDVAPALLDEARDDHRVLRHRVEAPAVPAEPAHVGQRPRDVADVELLGVGLERVHETAGDGLQIRPRRGRSVFGSSHASIITPVRHSYDET